MNYYMDLDPYVIRERKEGLLREVSALRLEKQLRDERGPSTSRLAALAQRIRLPLLGRALAQRES